MDFAVSLPVDPKLYLTYLAVMTIMAITPGPANVFAIASGLGRGAKPALTAVAGMNLATIVWFSAAALGLGALVAAFPQAFQVLAYLGAAYVAWLGVKSLLDARSPEKSFTVKPRAQSGGSDLLDGFTVQIANPKAVLFFTAVLPPFLDPERALLPQLFVFGATTLTLDILAMGGYALGAAALSARLANPKARAALSFGVGLLLLASAALIAFR